MAPGKLRMKRTPEEQVAHDFRKSQRASRKVAKKAHRSRSRSPSSSRHKKRRTERVSKVDDERRTPYDPEARQGESSTPRRYYRESKPDWDEIHAHIEEEHFRDKLWEALGDDERLDGVEARLNSYAHVPRRWRGGGMDRMEDDSSIDPQYMEDEDYAEWLRLGMWRKKHAAEHAEQVRLQAERDARLEKEKALRLETERLQRAAADQRRRRTVESQQLRMEDARAAYEKGWKLLLGPSADRILAFDDIPWPVFPHEPSALPSGTEFLTGESVLTFLVPSVIDSSPVDQDTVVRFRKERLRETLLRFHPDKFEGRILPRVREQDRGRVKETTDKLVRIVNTLMTGT